MTFCCENAGLTLAVGSGGYICINLLCGLMISTEVEMEWD